jgi:hypothetical protein
MHVIRHQMAIENLALFLPGQRMEDFSQVPTRLPEQHFAPSLRASHIMRTFLRPPPFTIAGIRSLDNLSVLLSG